MIQPLQIASGSTISIGWCSLFTEDCSVRIGQYLTKWTTSYSVFDSFYAAADKGRFPDLTDQSDLWQLLLRMSARKVIGKRRHDRRQRRGADVKLRSLDDGEDNKTVIGDEPTPEMVLLTRESVEQYFSHFGVGHLRDLSGARLEGNLPRICSALRGRESVARVSRLTMSPCSTRESSGQTSRPRRTGERA